MKKLQGIGASKGIVKANAFIIGNTDLKITKKKVSDSSKEITKFNIALKKATKQIEDLKKNAVKKLGQEKAEIFEAHKSILLDSQMLEETLTLIKDEKINSEFAYSQIANKYIEMFKSMEDAYLKERAADVKDVSTRLIKNILNIEISDLSLINKEVIIVAHDLTPSETSQLNPKFVKGFITEIGGRTSHSAIMARTLEIPAVVGCGKSIFSIKDDELIILNGNVGEIYVSPDKKTIATQEKERDNWAKELKETKLFKNKKSVSKDGWTTKIAANIGTPEDLPKVIDEGAEGIGLFRSEFLYMDSNDWPTEEEQFQAYKKVVSGMKGKKVVIRTLDIGGDKKLNYFTFPHELNPFLGYRAVRLQLDKKDIFITQIRALLRASAFGDLAINVPMIAIVEEFLEVKKLFKKVEDDLKKKKIKVGKYELGIMVEIPSTVELIDKFAKHADFFSIGTNDLIQYTFAADRMSEKVSYLYQPFNPAILRKIKKVIDASHKEGKWTAVCGEMAIDTKLSPIFVGMGLDEFSMSASGMLRVRRIISKMNKSDCEKLVEKVLDLETEEQVKKVISNYLAKLN